jgi:hypothetical protein
MVREQTREMWVKRIERWKDSGLTAAAFAREIGVRARTLSWWHWKLSSEAKPRDVAPAAMTEAASTTTMTEAASTTTSLSATEPRRRRRSKQGVAHATAMTFVEVTSPLGALEVVLATGRQIRVPIGFDETTLERLVGILERRA